MQGGSKSGRGKRDIEEDVSCMKLRGTTVTVYFLITHRDGLAACGRKINGTVLPHRYTSTVLDKVLLVARGGPWSLFELQTPGDHHHQQHRSPSGGSEAAFAWFLIAALVLRFVRLVDGNLPRNSTEKPLREVKPKIVTFRSWYGIDVFGERTSAMSPEWEQWKQVCTSTSFLSAS